jgi:uncharacterized protein YndB with AHSA1/START domain
MRTVEASVIINKPPAVVLAAFTEQHHLYNWWKVSKSLIDLRKGGLYSLAWQTNSAALSFVYSGTVGEYLPGCQLRIDNLVYINPERSVLGPMQLLIMTTPEHGKTVLDIIQSGYQQGPDWDWYYEAVKAAWPAVSLQIKDYLESADSFVPQVTK